MAYVKLSSPPTIGNVVQNTGQFSAVGVGAAATTAALYVNASNRIGTWITGNNISTGADADGIFVDCSFNPSANVTNAASIGLYPTFAPPLGITITNAYGLYIASGTQGGAGSVTTGYGLYVTSPTFGTANKAANIGGLIVDSGGTGTISAGVWQGTNIAVNHGGTGTNTLTNHGVLIGQGTSAIVGVGPVASTGCVLQSNGVGSDPGFSTATYPSIATGTGTILRADGSNWVATTATYPNTTTINRILFSSANNTISEITTASQSTMITSTTGVPSFVSMATDGKVLIGSTAGNPAAATLTAGAGISITNGSNSISIAATGAAGGGIVWSDVTGATQTIVAGTGYLADRGGGVAFTLPASSTIGDVFVIAGVQGSWTLAQAAGQQIKIGSSATTIGVTGSLASTNANDCIYAVASNTSASSVWIVIHSMGNITVA